MSSAPISFQRPSSAERVFNRLFGFLVGMGSASATTILGKFVDERVAVSTPHPSTFSRSKVGNFWRHADNAMGTQCEAAGEVRLIKGSLSQKSRIRPLTDQANPDILKAYLDNFKREV